MVAHDIKITWVRHAETIGNVLEGNITDFYDFMKETGGKRSSKNLNYKEEKDYNTNTFEDFINVLKTTELEENKAYAKEISQGIVNFKLSNNYRLYEMAKDKIADKNFMKNLEKERKDMLPQMELTKMVGDIKTFNVDTWKDFESDPGGTIEKIKAKWLSKMKGVTREPGDVLKPPCTWIFTPTLTYNGIRQAKLLGIEYLAASETAGETAGETAAESEAEAEAESEEEEVGGGGARINNYDLIICSPTVRTIMTALCSIFSAIQNGVIDFADFKKKYNKIIIVPYINEKYNGAGYFDRANAAVPFVIIDKVIKAIVEFMLDKTNKVGLDMPTQDQLIDLIEVKYYKAEMEGNDTNELRKRSEGNYETFMDEFLPNFLSVKPATNILAFSHGKVIDEDIKKNVKKNFKLALFPNNCSVWEVEYKKEGSKYEMDSSKYDLDNEYADVVQNLAGKYFTRDTMLPEPIGMIAKDYVEKKFPFPAYLGGLARRSTEKFDEEKDMFETNNVGSLTEDHLRGIINKLWVGCVDNAGHDKCGNVGFIKSTVFNKEGGGKSTTRKRNRSSSKRKRRHGKKYTKKIIKRKNKNKRTKNKNRKTKNKH